MLLPAVPTVAADVLVRHDAVRRSLADELAAAPTPVAQVFRRVQRRIALESLAGVTPVVSERIAPPRRRFLSVSARGRLRGCELAFDHIEARGDRLRHGWLSCLIGPDTVTTVHALVRSHDAGISTDAGLLRVTDARFDPTETDYAPPGAAACAALLDEAISVVNAREHAAVVRAGWFTATVLAIHPFTDGNGRTARLLHHLVAGSDQVAGADVGTAEVWAVARDAYVSALKSSQRPATRGDAIDASAFVSFAVETATVGAELASRRLTALSDLWDAPWDSLSGAARALEIAVALDSTSAPEELRGLAHDLVDTDDLAYTAILDELVERRRLVWDGAGLLRVSADHPMLDG